MYYLHHFSASYTSCLPLYSSRSSHIFIYPLIFYIYLISLYIHLSYVIYIFQYTYIQGMGYGSTHIYYMYPKCYLSNIMLCGFLLVRCGRISWTVFDCSSNYCQHHPPFQNIDRVNFVALEEYLCISPLGFQNYCSIEFLPIEVVGCLLGSTIIASLLPGLL